MEKTCVSSPVKIVNFVWMTFEIPRPQDIQDPKIEYSRNQDPKTLMNKLMMDDHKLVKPLVALFFLRSMEDRPSQQLADSKVDFCF